MKSKEADEDTYCSVNSQLFQFLSTSKEAYFIIRQKIIEYGFAKDFLRTIETFPCSMIKGMYRMACLASDNKSTFNLLLHQFSKRDLTKINIYIIFFTICSRPHLVFTIKTKIIIEMDVLIFIAKN